METSTIILLKNLLLNVKNEKNHKSL